MKKLRVSVGDYLLISLIGIVIGLILFGMRFTGNPYLVWISDVTGPTYLVSAIVCHFFIEIDLDK